MKIYRTVSAQWLAHIWKAGKAVEDGNKVSSSWRSTGFLYVCLPPSYCLVFLDTREHHLKGIIRSFFLKLFFVSLSTFYFLIDFFFLVLFFGVLLCFCFGGEVRERMSDFSNSWNWACIIDSPNFDGCASLRSLLFKVICMSTSGKTSNTWGL